MKSQQVKSLLSACNLLFLFTPCSALIDLPMLHLPCLVLVEPRKRWTDDRLGQTVTRLEITLCLMC